MHGRMTLPEAQKRLIGCILTAKPIGQRAYIFNIRVSFACFVYLVWTLVGLPGVGLRDLSGLLRLIELPGWSS